jgi:hypothetical protein
MLADRIGPVIPPPDGLGHFALLQVPGFDRQDLIAPAFDAADVMAGQVGDGTRSHQTFYFSMKFCQASIHPIR